MKALGGRFIVFDGPDGAGKSTQIARLEQAARVAGIAEVVCVREPGGTEVGERIRAILLDPTLERMSLRCEMMLYMASRAQLMEEVVRPALERGALVLADRFISATLAYQGTASGMAPESILAVGRVAVGSVWPDLTLILDVDATTASRRMGPERDRIEQRGDVYHERVRQGFLAQASAEPDRFAVIDATADPDTVAARVRERVEQLAAAP